MPRIDQPRAVRLADVRDEGRDLRTFFFDEPIDAKPGQFVMLWVPGVDLKPFGVAYHTPDRFGVTVAKVGPFTEALFAKPVGAFLGYTGPYGTSFAPGDAKHLVLVGGGYGTATLAPLADWALANGRDVDFIIGARSADHILYEARYQSTAVKLHIITDDGSAGRKGRTTDVLTERIAAGGVDYVASCGPERMLHAIATMAMQVHIPCEVSIERYMKCGFGVCGACCVDGTGERICVEGTVMDASHALTLTEFGQYHRARSGTRVPV